MTRGYTQTRVFMDTRVVIELSARGQPEEALAELTDRAYGWFAEVEQRCSRFDSASELRGLSQHIGEPVTVSALSILRLVPDPPGRIVGGSVRIECRNLVDLS